MRGRKVMRVEFDPAPEPGPWTKRLCVAAVLIICATPLLAVLYALFREGF